jgi:hypothetical protein
MVSFPKFNRLAQTKMPTRDVPDMSTGSQIEVAVP